MQLNEIVDDTFNEIFTDKIEFLSVYKMQRNNEFPGVPVRFFTDWGAHREWMRAERNRQVRRLNNLRVQASADQDADEANTPQGG